MRVWRVWKYWIQFSVCCMRLKWYGLRSWKWNKNETNRYFYWFQCDPHRTRYFECAANCESWDGSNFTNWREEIEKGQFDAVGALFPYSLAFFGRDPKEINVANFWKWHFSWMASNWNARQLDKSRVGTARMHAALPECPTWNFFLSSSVALIIIYLIMT